MTVELEAVVRKLAHWLAELLNIKGKRIEVLWEKEHSEAMASVCVMKRGKELSNHEEEKALSQGDYDTIRIRLYENKQLRNGFSEGTQQLFILSEIVHELLHIRYPKATEDEIADLEAEVTGQIMTLLNERKN